MRTWNNLRVAKISRNFLMTAKRAWLLGLDYKRRPLQHQAFNAFLTWHESEKELFALPHPSISHLPREDGMHKSRKWQVWLMSIYVHHSPWLPITTFLQKDVGSNPWENSLSVSFLSLWFAYEHYVPFQKFCC